MSSPQVLYPVISSSSASVCTEDHSSQPSEGSNTRSGFSLLSIMSKIFWWSHSESTKPPTQREIRLLAENDQLRTRVTEMSEQDRVSKVALEEMNKKFQASEEQKRRLEESRSPERIKEIVKETCPPMDETAEGEMQGLSQKNRALSGHVTDLLRDTSLQSTRINQLLGEISLSHGQLESLHGQFTKVSTAYHDNIDLQKSLLILIRDLISQNGALARENHRLIDEQSRIVPANYATSVGQIGAPPPMYGQPPTAPPMYPSTV